MSSHEAILDLEGFGRRVAERRRELGLTQEGLGRMIDVYQVTVCRWERGGSVPPAAILCRLASALGVTMEFLVCRPPRKSPGKVGS